MRSRWIEHKGKKIFFQDFSGHNLLEADIVKTELTSVQEVVVHEAESSVLVLADFTDTQISKDLMDLLVKSSNLTKSHIRRTAVLGITGTKRILADMLFRMTGQSLSFFDDADNAKDWLTS